MDKTLDIADLAKKLHEAEIREAFNAGFDEGYFMNDPKYNPEKAKYENSKDYYVKKFVKCPSKI